MVNRLLIILVFLLALSGCATREPITVTEFVTVEVPVICKIDRPNRPKYIDSQSVPTYLSKLITYTEVLEMIIDEHNTKR